MKKVLIILGAVALMLTTGYFPKSHYETTDYKCFNDCLSRGYSYGYCKYQCSYEN